MATAVHRDRVEPPDAGTAEDDRSVDGQHDATTDETILQSIKAHPKVIMYSVFMTVGPLIYGFDNIIVGLVTAVPAFQEIFGRLHNGSYIIPSIWLSLWNAFVQIGIMVGSVINGSLSDRFGRRLSFITGALIAVASIAFLYTADRAETLDQRRGIFLLGKTLLGVGLGMLNSTCQTYISEIAPTRLRGPLLSIFTFFMVLGQLIGVAIIYARINMPTSGSYRVAFASQWAFAGLAVIVGLAVPESPSYYLKKGKVEQACHAYGRLYEASTVDAGIRDLANTLESENRRNEVVQETNYKELFQGTNWRRTRIILWANIFQQFLGITLLSNVSYFLELAGMSASKSLMITQLGVGLGLPANVVSWFAMTMLGRRTILLFSTSTVGVFWLGIGVAGCWPDSSKALWFIGVMIIIIIFFYGLGVGGAYPVVAGEVSSVRLRAKSQGLGFLVNGFFSWAFNFFVPYMFNADEANLGGKMGFFFFGLCAIGAVVIFLEIPETKGRTYAELDEMFEKRLPTRQFSTYVCQDALDIRENEKGLEA